MGHRGPDASKMQFEDCGHAGVQFSLGFGHQRLAIIDLDARSEQPFSAAGTLTVYNGEIYNYRDLKTKMVGEVFNTSGDTELFAKWIAKKGTAGIGDFVGQWAGVQWIASERRLLLTRDFYGKKPLFIYKDENIFIASSTVRAIALYLGRTLRFKHDFLESFVVSYGAYLPGTESHVEGITQIGPGQCASFDLESWALNKTGDIRQLEKISDVAPPERPEDLFALIENAVLDRLVSDRDVGLFVSGGVDSTLILSILHKHGKLDAVSCMIGETGLSPDAHYAKAITARLGVKAEVVEIDYSSFGFDQFLNVSRMQERPFALSGNLVAMAQLYARVAQTDIKVVLDGTGADEVFGGYWDRYAPFAFREALSKRKIGWLLNTALRNLAEPRRLRHAVRIAMRGSQLPGDPAIARMLNLSDKQFLEAGTAFDPLATITPNLAEAQVSDIFHGRLQDWLWQNDRNSMAFSIESRSPFMDRRLFPYVNAPLNKKFRGEFNKYALRQVFDYVGGAETQWRRQKQGFRYQPNVFLKKNRVNILEYLTESNVVREHFPCLDSDTLAADGTPIALIGKLLAIAAADEAIRV
jgi:asparagine synthase (glutamine-hydrolysing)